MDSNSLRLSLLICLLMALGCGAPAQRDTSTQKDKEVAEVGQAQSNTIHLRLSFGEDQSALLLRFEGDKLFLTNEDVNATQRVIDAAGSGEGGVTFILDDLPEVSSFETGAKLAIAKRKPSTSDLLSYLGGGFQFLYEADNRWWDQLPDGMKKELLLDSTAAKIRGHLKAKYKQHCDFQWLSSDPSYTPRLQLSIVGSDDDLGEEIKRSLPDLLQSESHIEVSRTPLSEAIIDATESTFVDKTSDFDSLREAMFLLVIEYAESEAVSQLCGVRTVPNLPDNAPTVQFNGPLALNGSVSSERVKVKMISGDGVDKLRCVVGAWIGTAGVDGNPDVHFRDKSLDVHPTAKLKVDSSEGNGISETIELTKMLGQGSAYSGGTLLGTCPPRGTKGTIEFQCSDWDKKRELSPSKVEFTID